MHDSKCAKRDMECTIEASRVGFWTVIYISYFLAADPSLAKKTRTTCLVTVTAATVYRITSTSFV